MYFPATSFANPGYGVLIQDQQISFQMSSLPLWKSTLNIGSFISHCIDLNTTFGTNDIALAKTVLY